MELTLLVIFSTIKISLSTDECSKISPTTASGSQVSGGQYCQGQLIFEDNFDEFNFKKWQHEISFTGSAVSFSLFYNTYLQ